jgi:hypothetical protein
MFLIRLSRSGLLSFQWRRGVALCGCGKTALKLRLTGPCNGVKMPRSRMAILQISATIFL